MSYAYDSGPWAPSGCLAQTLVSVGCKRIKVGGSPGGGWRQLTVWARFLGCQATARAVCVEQCLQVGGLASTWKILTCFVMLPIWKWACQPFCWSHTRIAEETQVTPYSTLYQVQAFPWEDGNHILFCNPQESPNSPDEEREPKPSPRHQDTTLHGEQKSDLKFTFFSSQMTVGRVTFYPFAHGRNGWNK
jgi:hypothetical protein